MKFLKQGNALSCFGYIMGAKHRGAMLKSNHVKGCRAVPGLVGGDEQGPPDH
jgi:hypothetical protein